VTKKLKPVQVPLDADVQEALMGLPVYSSDHGVVTVGVLIAQAREAIERANRALGSSKLVDLTAQQIMRKENRRGEPKILVSPDGEVSLWVTYGEEQTLRDIMRASKLPSLDELRAQAEELGVDISDLGRAKTLIIQRLAAHGESR
jgi:hypothetical protein